MKRLLNTLYVTTKGAYLHHEGESVLVEVERETRLRVPIHGLGGIVCFGVVSCSPSLLHLCSERDVLVSFLSENGRYLARVQGPVSGNVLLRREQFRRADDRSRSAGIARSVVVGKLVNCRTVLQRAVRDHGGTPEIEGAVTRLGRILNDVRESRDVESLRGLEGDAAKTYFDAFDHLIVAQKDAFCFRGRTRRPPTDNVNALLSFLYTLLAHDCSAALQAVGLDPQVGFLHADRPGRPGLALDLMEEFRPILADRLALSLINMKQVQGGGFQTTESGGVLMEDDTRKSVLVAYQKRKQECLRHTFLEEEIETGLLFHIQAQLLARHLRGDLDAYPPFVWR